MHVRWVGGSICFPWGTAVTDPWFLTGVQRKPRKWTEKWNGVWGGIGYKELGWNACGVRIMFCRVLGKLPRGRMQVWFLTKQNDLLLLIISVWLGRPHGVLGWWPMGSDWSCLDRLRLRTGRISRHLHTCLLLPWLDRRHRQEKHATICIRLKSNMGIRPVTVEICIIYANRYGNKRII